VAVGAAAEAARQVLRWLHDMLSRLASSGFPRAGCLMSSPLRACIASPQVAAHCRTMSMETDVTKLTMKGGSSTGTQRRLNLQQ
jgi:hypothetical protein